MNVVDLLNIISIIIPILILLLGIFTWLKKIDIGTSPWSYLLLIIFPFWLWLFSKGILGFFSTPNSFSSILNIIIAILYVLEIIMIPYLLIKMILLPIKSLAESKQKLQYAIFVSIYFTILCVIPTIICFGYLIQGIGILSEIATKSQHSLLEAIIYLPLILFAVSPFTTIFMGSALFIMGSILMLISIIASASILVFALVSTIQCLQQIQLSRKNTLLYILSCFVPILNTIILFKLYFTVKKFIQVDSCDTLI